MELTSWLRPPRQCQLCDRPRIGYAMFGSHRLWICFFCATRLRLAQEQEEFREKSHAWFKTHTPV